VSLSRRCVATVRRVAHDRVAPYRRELSNTLYEKVFGDANMRAMPRWRSRCEVNPRRLQAIGQRPQEARGRRAEALSLNCNSDIGSMRMATLMRMNIRGWTERESGTHDVDIRGQVSRAGLERLQPGVEHGMPAEEVRDKPTIWHLYWEAAAGRKFFPRKKSDGHLEAFIVRAFKGPGRALVTQLTCM